MTVHIGVELTELTLRLPSYHARTYRCDFFRLVHTISNRNVAVLCGVSIDVVASTGRQRLTALKGQVQRSIAGW